MTRKLEIAIVDDNRECVEHLRQLLEICVDANVLTFPSGVDFMATYQPQLFDYVFIDVLMPGATGFDVAGRIREVDPDVGIVFATSMGEDMREGFVYRATDYLVKPVTQVQLDRLLPRLTPTIKTLALFTIKLDGKVVRLAVGDILYFESDNKHVTAVTEGGNYKFRASLQDLAMEPMLGRFLRIHRSYLVNPEWVYMTDMAGKTVSMKNFKDLPMSRKYKKVVEAQLGKKW